MCTEPPRIDGGFAWSALGTSLKRAGLDAGEPAIEREEELAEIVAEGHCS